MKPATKRVAGRSYSSAGLATCSIRPPFITAIRSEIDSASVWSCVTMTKVVPSRACRFFSSTCMCSRSAASSADRGSSSSSSFGSQMIARASATRCRWPPDSAATGRPAKAPSPTRSSASPTRRRISPEATPRTERPKPTLPATVMCGNTA